MNQGTFNLGSIAVTTALTNSVITTGTSPAGSAQAFLDRFEGMQFLALFCNFTYGSGGTTCIVYVQTTFDDVNWIDVARFDFGKARVAVYRCGDVDANALSGESREVQRSLDQIVAAGRGQCDPGSAVPTLHRKVSQTS